MLLVKLWSSQGLSSNEFKSSKLALHFPAFSQGSASSLTSLTQFSVLGPLKAGPPYYYYLNTHGFSSFSFTKNIPSSSYLPHLLPQASGFPEAIWAKWGSLLLRFWYGTPRTHFPRVTQGSQTHKNGGRRWPLTTELNWEFFGATTSGEWFCLLPRRERLTCCSLRARTMSPLPDKKLPDDGPYPFVPFTRPHSYHFETQGGS